ncbi:hypothetical protein [Methylobacterium radiotolerans]|uniref:hypothetical protein n=1 Tax=Methylobacterium radiotolerans TaxID=31998 RepID=UPI001AD810EF|nr:hypothetical protein [Methylobacterium organophilum]
MPVSPLRDDEDRRRGVSTLKRIAATLDLPDWAFSNDLPTRTEGDDVMELLRIWQSLEHSADRRQLLGFARTLLAGRR